MRRDGRGGQFAALPARAIDDRRLRPAAVMVLAALATYADRDGWAYPSISTISDRLRVTRQAVQRQISILVEAGYLIVAARFRQDGGRSSNQYRIIYSADLPANADCNSQQPDVAPPATPDVAPPATSDVAGLILPPHLSSHTTTTTTRPPEPSAPEGKVVGGGDNEDEYVQLAAEEYVRAKGYGPEKLVGTALSIRRRLKMQRGMTDLDRDQLAAFRAQKAEIQAMRSRMVNQREEQQPDLAAPAEITHFSQSEATDPLIWQQVREHLRAALPANIYALWVEPLTCLGLKGNRLKLVGPDMYFCSWFADNYLQATEAALQDVGLAGGKVWLTASCES